jgi:hypothetical protein
LSATIFFSPIVGYEATPEKPTFCVVIDSVSVCGVPSSVTTTRMRTKIRHGSPNQIARKLTKAFSVTNPAGSLHRTEAVNSVFLAGAKFKAGSNRYSSDLNCPCGKCAAKIFNESAPWFSISHPIIQHSSTPLSFAETWVRAICGEFSRPDCSPLMRYFSRASARNSCWAIFKMRSLIARSRVNLASIRPLRLSSSSMN